MRLTGLEVFVLWAIAASLVGVMLPALGASDRGPGHAVGLVLAAVSVLVAAGGSLAWAVRRLVGWWRGHSEPGAAPD